MTAAVALLRNTPQTLTCVSITKAGELAKLSFLYGNAEVSAL